MQPAKTFNNRFLPALAVTIRPGSNTFIFIICTAIALLFWSLKSLDQEYETTIGFPIEYQNFPKNQVLKDSLPNQVNLDIKASGWDILTLKTGTEIYPIKIDFQDSRGLKEMVLTKNSVFLDKKVPEGIEVEDIRPDTLSIAFDQKAEKTVPVKLDGSITYKDNHGLADSIQVVPSRIHLEGPQSYLAETKEIRTQSFEFQQVEQKLVRNIKLKKPEYPFIDFDHEFVKLILPVETLTEGTVKVPVELKNPYFYAKLELVPQFVEVTYQTALSNYPEINSEDFTVLVNTDPIQQQKRPNTLKALLTEKPAFTYHTRIQPKRINYLIQEPLSNKD